MSGFARELLRCQSVVCESHVVDRGLRCPGAGNDVIRSQRLGTGDRGARMRGGVDDGKCWKRDEREKLLTGAPTWLIRSDPSVAPMPILRQIPGRGRAPRRADALTAVHGKTPKGTESQHRGRVAQLGQKRSEADQHPWD